jgi:uncharacterized protein YkwD
MLQTNAHRARPQVEQLEDRQLMAGHITLNAALGVVNVQGSPRRDRVLVSYNRQGDVRVNMTGGARGLGVFPRDAVREVVVRGNREQIVNRTNIPVVKTSGPSLDARQNLPSNASGVPQGADGLSAAEQYILQQTNAYRASRGLPPLVINPLLETMARNLANGEAGADRYGDSNTNGHIFQGHDFVWRANQVGYNWQTVGENVADNWGYADPVQHLSIQWWTSPEHQANILDADYVEIGIGVATSASGKTYGVVDFGRQM